VVPNISRNPSVHPFRGAPGTAATNFSFVRRLFQEFGLFQEFVAQVLECLLPSGRLRTLAWSVWTSTMKGRPELFEAIVVRMVGRSSLGLGYSC
jgi:hypothetical protein